MENTPAYGPVLNSILQSVEQLSREELAILSAEIQKRKRSENRHILPAQEADLLEKINAGPSPELTEKLRFLRVRQSENKLSDEEHRELLILTESIENQNVIRLENLISLAKIRKISLQKLSEELELTVRLDVA